MKQQKQSGSAHLIIVMIMALVIVGLLGFVFWQNFIQPKTGDSKTNDSTSSPSEKTETATASMFTESLDNFNSKTLIGSDGSYDVYILDNESSISILEGNVLVYSKSIKKAMEINKSISIFEAGLNAGGMKRQDDSYLVVDSGTGPDRAKKLVMLEDRDVIEVNLVVNDMIYWDGHYIYTANDATYNNRPYGSGNSLSIFSLDMSKKSSSKIVASTSDNDYIASSISGNTLNYSESPASNPNNSAILTLDLNNLN